jgi:phosphoglycolate phosphatase
VGRRALVRSRVTDTVSWNGRLRPHDPADLRLCLVGDTSWYAARDLLVLWDLDGTLLNAGGVGADLYSVVFLQLFGRSLETMAPMAGRTDRAIILETLTQAGVPEPRRHVDPFIAELAARAPTARTSVAARGRALPGAAAALAALASGRAHQSVLTGNVRAVAEVKLAALGLRDPLDLRIGAYGDDHEDRAELVHLARRRAAAVHERSGTAGFRGAGTVVVGDTPLDVAAALAAGARAVGVATGPFSVAELRAAGADVVLPDLSDTRLVVEALLWRLRRLGVRLWRCGGAGRGALFGLTRPAAAGERAGDLRRRAAAMAGDVVPVVAQRRAAAGRGVVVAAAVLAAPFRGVRELPVELDDEPELLVIAVAEAAAAAGLGERHLLACPGQPVRALDAAVVPEFQQRVRSPGRRDDHLVELSPPAKLPAPAQRGPQRPLPRQPPPERGGHPPAGLIEAIRRLHEVNHGLLNERMRHHPPRKPRLDVEVRGQMYFHAIGWTHPPVRGNGHVNEPRLAFGEPIHLGGRLVAQLSPFARIKHSGPQLRIPPNRPAKRRVHARINLPPPAALDL